MVAAEINALRRSPQSNIAAHDILAVCKPA
jgi:hypothetical protein